MSFLAPAWIGAAVAAALGAVLLHLITTQRPPASVLPTARFVPAGDARASSRAARPADLPLLALRCVALLLLGAAFAGPVTRPGGTSLARVIVADRSRGAQGDVRDSARTLFQNGDALVLFDSAASVVTSGAADSIGALTSGRARGSLSAALVGARRAARELAQRADSVELVVVSPLTGDELDAASAGMFANWPGRARLVRSAAARHGSPAVTLVSDDADDALRPVVAALNAESARGAAGAVRIVRAAASAADSAAARAGAALVVWPRAGAAPATAQGLLAAGATMVAPLARISLPAGGAIVARWADGAPAAAEWPLGAGCVRMIGAGLPAAGDISLQPAFFSVARALLAECSGAAMGAPAADSVAKSFARPGPAATAAALRSGEENSPLAPWLFGAALLLLVGELFVRRGAAEAAA
ncbi:MAG TPA: BatA domain-containing protein [Gemmatimonadaceae bacterium]|nr:BatA domain-containing protein [Gemmatimonadaceae bacterium]